MCRSEQGYVVLFRWKINYELNAGKATFWYIKRWRSAAGADICPSINLATLYNKIRLLKLFIFTQLLYKALKVIFWLFLIAKYSKIAFIISPSCLLCNYIILFYFFFLYVFFLCLHLCCLWREPTWTVTIYFYLLFSSFLLPRFTLFVVMAYFYCYYYHY